MVLLTRLSHVSALDLLRELDRRQFAEKRTSKPYFEARSAAEIREDLADLDEATILAAIRLYPSSKGQCFYGEDSRRDIFQVTDNEQIKTAECIVAMVKWACLRPAGPAYYSIETEVYGQYKKLCSSEPFWLQPSASIHMTGAMVRPNVVLTAGHGVCHVDIEDFCFVRGWAMTSPWNGPSLIHRKDVLHIKRVIKCQPGPTTDWALIELKDRSPGPHLTKFRESGKIADERPLYAVGYPYGLPAKLIDGAAVRENNQDEFFSANLDTYDHNSGSPVFDAIEHTLEGIYVRGKEDFCYLSPYGCWTSFIVSDFGGPGEECTRTTEFYETLANL